MSARRFLCFSLLATAAACGSPIPDSTSDDAERAAESTVCLGSNKVYGIDVSSYDGTIKWADVKSAGKQFAIIRVSDGTGYHDPNFAANWKGAKAAGLVVGAYQFFRPNQDPTAQADYMLSQLTSVGFGAGDIPPVVDVEVMDGATAATVIAHVNTWLQHIKTKTGRLPAMYSSARVWTLLGNPTPSPLPYLWDAQWTTSCPTLPPAWGRLRFWQYADDGKVAGISDNVDLDVYNGTLSELRGL
jgi:lysozyme